MKIIIAIGCLLVGVIITAAHPDTSYKKHLKKYTTGATPTEDENTFALRKKSIGTKGNGMENDKLTEQSFPSTKTSSRVFIKNKKNKSGFSSAKRFNKRRVRDVRDANERWDIRYNIPGEPGRDYPIYAESPQTSFECNNRHDGYYADIETRCQIFHVCANTALGESGFSFLCPNGTVFSQQNFVCDWYTNVNCQESENFYYKNKALGKFIGSKEEMLEVVQRMFNYTLNNLVKPQLVDNNKSINRENINNNKENKKNTENDQSSKENKNKQTPVGTAKPTNKSTEKNSRRRLVPKKQNKTNPTSKKTTDGEIYISNLGELSTDTGAGFHVSLLKHQSDQQASSSNVNHKSSSFKELWADNTEELDAGLSQNRLKKSLNSHTAQTIQTDTPLDSSSVTKRDVSHLILNRDYLPSYSYEPPRIPFLEPYEAGFGQFFETPKPIQTIQSTTNSPEQPINRPDFSTLNTFDINHQQQTLTNHPSFEQTTPYLLNTDNPISSTGQPSSTAHLNQPDSVSFSIPFTNSQTTTKRPTSRPVFNSDDVEQNEYGLDFRQRVNTETDLVTHSNPTIFSSTSSRPRGDQLYIENENTDNYDELIKENLKFESRKPYVNGRFETNSDSSTVRISDTIVEQNNSYNIQDTIQQEEDKEINKNENISPTTPKEIYEPEFVTRFAYTTGQNNSPSKMLRPILVLLPPFRINQTMDDQEQMYHIAKEVQSNQQNRYNENKNQLTVVLPSENSSSSKSTTTEEGIYENANGGLEQTTEEENNINFKDLYGEPDDVTYSEKTTPVYPTSVPPYDDGSYLLLPPISVEDNNKPFSVVENRVISSTNDANNNENKAVSLNQDDQICDYRNPDGECNLSSDEAYEKAAQLALVQKMINILENRLKVTEQYATQTKASVETSVPKTVANDWQPLGQPLGSSLISAMIKILENAKGENESYDINSELDMLFSTLNSKSENSGELIKTMLNFLKGSDSANLKNMFDTNGGSDYQENYSVYESSSPSPNEFTVPEITISNPYNSLITDAYAFNHQVTEIPISAVDVKNHGSSTENIVIETPQTRQEGRFGGFFNNNNVSAAVESVNNNDFSGYFYENILSQDVLPLYDQVNTKPKDVDSSTVSYDHLSASTVKYIRDITTPSIAVDSKIQTNTSPISNTISSSTINPYKVTRGIQEYQSTPTNFVVNLFDNQFGQTDNLAAPYRELITPTNPNTIDDILSRLQPELKGTKLSNDESDSNSNALNGSESNEESESEESDSDEESDSNESDSDKNNKKKQNVGVNKKLLKQLSQILGTKSRGDLTLKKNDSTSNASNENGSDEDSEESDESESKEESSSNEGDSGKKKTKIKFSGSKENENNAPNQSGSNEENNDDRSVEVDQNLLKQLSQILKSKAYNKQTKPIKSIENYSNDYINNKNNLNLLSPPLTSTQLQTEQLDQIQHTAPHDSTDHKLNNIQDGSPNFYIPNTVESLNEPLSLPFPIQGQPLYSTSFGSQNQFSNQQSFFNDFSLPRFVHGGSPYSQFYEEPRKVDVEILPSYNWYLNDVHDLESYYDALRTGLITSDSFFNNPGYFNYRGSQQYSNLQYPIERSSDIQPRILQSSNQQPTSTIQNTETPTSNHYIRRSFKIPDLNHVPLVQHSAHKNSLVDRVGQPEANSEHNFFQNRRSDTDDQITYQDKKELFQGVTSYSAPLASVGKLPCDSYILRKQNEFTPKIRQECWE